MTNEDIRKNYPNILYVHAVINAVESYSDEYKLHDSVLREIADGFVHNNRTTSRAMLFMSENDMNQKTRDDALKKAYQDHREEIDSFINITDYEGPYFSELADLQDQLRRWDIFYDCN